MHEILAEHTNRLESKHFLISEIAEYISQTEKAAANYNWDAEDKLYVKEKALKKIKERLIDKYPDVSYLEQEAIKKLDEMIAEVM